MGTLKRLLPMKNTKLISILSILMLNYSCAKEGGEPFARSYSLQINFHNALGKNILEDIPNDHSESYQNLGGDKNGWTGIIEPALYEYEVILPEPCFRITSKPVGPPDIPPLYVNKYEEYYLLEFGVASPTICPPAHTITHKLTCPYIFGDNAEHTIVSYWKPRTGGVHKNWLLKDGTFALNFCYSITVDGKEFSVTQEPFLYFPNGNGMNNPTWDTVSVAWITLDNN